MLQTNLIGRTFKSKMDNNTEYWCVCVFIQNGSMVLVGANKEGYLYQFQMGQVAFIVTPRMAEESLLGVV